VVAGIEVDHHVVRGGSSIERRGYIGDVDVTAGGFGQERSLSGVQEPFRATLSSSSGTVTDE
jgi:hypothetical protein